MKNGWPGTTVMIIGVGDEDGKELVVIAVDGRATEGDDGWATERVDGRATEGVDGWATEGDDGWNDVGATGTVLEGCPARMSS